MFEKKKFIKCNKILIVFMIICIFLCDVVMNEDFVCFLSNICIFIVFYVLNYGVYY